MTVWTHATYTDLAYYILFLTLQQSNMISIKHNAVKQKWEDTEFPLVCETCLGDNPYIRMTKEIHGKPCKICEVPFTVFAWQAGTFGRLKKVEICQTCAKTQHVCQVCVFDLRYGLPVQMRDKVLREEGCNINNIAISHSDANRSWYNAQNERALVEHGSSSSIIESTSNIRAIARLQSIARMGPRYDRNLAKLCSFYARGECNRGSNCPFRHELPRDRNDPLSQQNTKDRFYGTNDPVADRMIGKAKEYSDKRKAENFMRGDERAVSTCYIRFHSNEDKTKLTEIDVRDIFYCFGEILAVRMHNDFGAFVEYTTSEAAELAIMGMNKKEWKGKKLCVNWARQPKRGNEGRLVVSGKMKGVEGSTVPPPGKGTAGSITLPVGLTPVTRPGTQVLDAVPVEGNLGESPCAKSNVSSKGMFRQPMSRPGGGPIRHVGSCILSTGIRRGAVPKPYYPSADPRRLGSREIEENREK